MVLHAEDALVAHLDRVELEVVEDRLCVLAEELPEGIRGCGLVAHGEIGDLPHCQTPELHLLMNHARFSRLQRTTLLRSLLA